MGGRGSASRSGRSSAASGVGAGGTDGASKKAAKASSGGGGGKSDAEKLVGTSVKSITKGMTQSSLSKMSRSKLETIGILQAAKNYMKRYNMGAEQALKQAKALAPQQTTAQLRKFVWKYRNRD